MHTSGPTPHGSGDCVPGGHCTHAVAPASTKSPAAHGRQILPLKARGHARRPPRRALRRRRRARAAHAATAEEIRGTLARRGPAAPNLRGARGARAAAGAAAVLLRRACAESKHLNPVEKNTILVVTKKNGPSASHAMTSVRGLAPLCGISAHCVFPAASWVLPSPTLIKLYESRLGESLCMMVTFEIFRRTPKSTLKHSVATLSVHSVWNLVLLSP